ncbi:hypothetical protein CRYUN_Cryun06bG0035800 [Craigia yunnanensis]
MGQWPGFGTVQLLRLNMEIMRTDVAPSFPQIMEMRTWSLNPEAPEFFPARNVIVSAPNCSIFPPINPPFFHYPTLSCLHSHALSAQLFSHPSYPYYPHQHAVQAHLLTPEKIAAASSVPVTKSVSSLLEPFKAKMVHEEAQDPRLVARKENTGGTRRRNKGKHYWRNKRYGKEGFVRVDGTQARKEAWMAKPSCYSTGDNKHFARNADQASFEYPKKVEGRAGNNNREKHPPILLKDDGNETTVMIRNIPNRYTREMLKDFLDQHCMITNRGAESQNAGADEEPSFSAFDFLYLPIDFVTESNKGYAFVNFTNPRAARKFFDIWHDKRWDCFQSNKIREICCAKLQGMEQLVKHFDRMEFPSEDFQPLSFNPARDGTKQLVKETIVGRCTGSMCTKSNLSG